MTLKRPDLPPPEQGHLLADCVLICAGTSEQMSKAIYCVGKAAEILGQLDGVPCIASLCIAEADLVCSIADLGQKSFEGSPKLIRVWTFASMHSYHLGIQLHCFS